MKIPPKRIRYKNQIELRLLSPNDGPVIFQAVQESKPALKRYMIWAHHANDLVKACSIYADFEAKALRGEEVNFAGFDMQSGEFLCCAALTPASRLNPLAFEIGYWVSSKHQGKGIGTIAAKILTVVGFQYFEANRMSITCNPENIASSKIIKKCGYQYEGVLRNFDAKATQEIIDQGLSPTRDISFYSLIPQDLSQLPWFDEMSRDIVLTHFHDT